jgi:hypothetical protein
VLSLPGLWLGREQERVHDSGVRDKDHNIVSINGTMVLMVFFRKYKAHVLQIKFKFPLTLYIKTFVINIIYNFVLILITIIIPV